MATKQVEAMSGAVTYEQCPHGDGTRRCKCGRCEKCGNVKHSAIHGPASGSNPGGKPLGHEFVEHKLR